MHLPSRLLTNILLLVTTVALILGITLWHPAVTQAAITSTCDQYGTWNVTPSTKNFVVMNNRWGASTAQCIKGDNANTSWSVSTSNHALPTNGAPAGYPAIYAGCHYNNCTSNSSMPKQYSSITSVQSNWSTGVPYDGSWNVAYDIWFNKTSSSSGQNNGAEIMIWLNNQGGVNPAGIKVASNVTIENATWDVWYTQLSNAGITWNYVVYRRTAPACSVNMDLKSFFNDSKNRGYIQSTWWLTSVQAGFEVWKGGVGLTTNSFGVTVR